MFYHHNDYEEHAAVNSTGGASKTILFVCLHKLL